jgi:hypothetical protein
MEVQLRDQWLIRAIETSLQRVQKSEFVKVDRLGAVSEPEFLNRVQSFLNTEPPKKAA